MKVLGVGIIGAGRMGERHAEAYSKIPGIRIIGITDVVKERAATLSRKHGCRTFRSASDLVRVVDIDAVSICTPNNSHTAPCLLAFEHGKDVLVEKPLAASLRDCDKMITAARRGSRVLMVGQTHRFFADNIVAKRVLDSGALGKILAAHDHFISRGMLPGKKGPPRWTRTRAAGGGIFMDTVHVVDKFRWWFRSEVVAVRTLVMGQLEQESETDQFGLAHMEMTGGIHCVLTEFAPFPVADKVVKVIGNKGLLSVRDGEEVALGTRNGWRIVPFPHMSKQPLYAHTLAGFVAELEEFVTSIREDRQPLVTGADGRKAVEVALGFYRSARTGKRVSMK